MEVPAPVAGRLLAVHAQQGDRVEAGQLLAELDQRALTLVVRGAEAEAAAAAGGLAQARSRLQSAQRAVGRAKELLSQGLASREDVAAAESDLAQAQAALQAALGQKRAAGEHVASAKLSQTFTRIESPMAGVVLKAPERVGSLASPEQGALFIVGTPLDTVRVDAQVSETEISSVRVGGTAEVVVAALPGRTFEGRVEWVGIEAERREGAVLYPIRLSVPNPEKQLLPGMTARVSIEVARAENVLSAHEAALRFSPMDADPAPPRSRVWKRVGPRELQSIPVKSGVSDGFHVQIEPSDDHVKEGDALVVGLMNPEGAKAPRVSLGAKK
jgi:HlyD family secretion protein